MDEPFGALDCQTREEMQDLLLLIWKQLSITIVFVTHDMELVATYAKRVIVLSHGQVLLDDSCRNVFYHPEILRQTNLFPPQIARLAQMFAQKPSLFSRPLTVEEIYQEILNLPESTPHVCCS